MLFLHVAFLALILVVSYVMTRNLYFGWKKGHQETETPIFEAPCLAYGKIPGSRFIKAPIARHAIYQKSLFFAFGKTHFMVPFEDILGITPIKGVNGRGAEYRFTIKDSKFKIFVLSGKLYSFAVHFQSQSKDFGHFDFEGIFTTHTIKKQRQEKLGEPWIISIFISLLVVTLASLPIWHYWDIYKHRSELLSFADCDGLTVEVNGEIMDDFSQFALDVREMIMTKASGSSRHKTAQIDFYCGDESMSVDFKRDTRDPHLYWVYPSSSYRGHTGFVRTSALDDIS